MSIESYFLILRSTSEVPIIHDLQPQDTTIPESIENKAISQSREKVYDVLFEADFISEFNLLIRHFNLNPETSNGELEITPELASELITVLDYITTPSLWSHEYEATLKYNQFFNSNIKSFSNYFANRFNPNNDFYLDEDHSEFEMFERVSNVLKAFLTIYKEYEMFDTEIRCVYKTYHT